MYKDTEKTAKNLGCASRVAVTARRSDCVFACGERYVSEGGVGGLLSGKRSGRVLVDDKVRQLRGSALKEV
jgi:hypothetical protein